MKPYHQFTADPDDTPEHNPAHTDDVMKGTGWGVTGARGLRTVFDFDSITVGGVDLTPLVTDVTWMIEPAAQEEPPQ